MNSLLIVFDLLFLATFAWYDYKTHSIPTIATLFFVIISLMFTTLDNVIATVALVILLFLLSRTMFIGNGDRKLLFGLTLQFGLTFTATILGVTFAILVLKGILINKKATPLIPLFFVGYLVAVAGILL